MNNIVNELVKNSKNVCEMIHEYFGLENNEMLVADKSYYLSDGNLYKIKSVKMENGNKSIYETFYKYDINGNNIEISTIKKDDSKNIIPKHFSNRVDIKFEYDKQNRITCAYKNGKLIDEYSYTSTGRTTHTTYNDDGTIDKITTNKDDEIVKRVIYDKNGDDVFYYSVTARRGYKIITQRINTNGVLVESRSKYEQKNYNYILSEFSETHKQFGVVIFKKESTKIEYNSDNTKRCEEYFIEKVSECGCKNIHEYGAYYTYDDKSRLKLIEQKVDGTIINCIEYDTFGTGYEIIKENNRMNIKGKLSNKSIEQELYCSINNDSIDYFTVISNDLKSNEEFVYKYSISNHSNNIFREAEPFTEENIKFNYKNMTFVLNSNIKYDKVVPVSILISIFDKDTAKLTEEYTYIPKSDKGIKFFCELKEDILSRNKEIIDYFENDVKRFIEETK